jgi:regulator of sigma E protease
VAVMSIILALIMFSLLVFVHELGHFLLAKKNGITVLEFSIGMGPRIASFVRNGTRYSIKLFPLGGSCAMAGEDEATDDENGFNKKSVWARISVVFAGPIFNFILAFVMAVIVIGMAGFDAPVIGGLYDGYPAEEAGIQVNDRIVSVNGERVHLFRDLSLYVALHAGEPLTIGLDRDGQDVKVNVVPQQDENGYYYIGILSVGRIKGNALDVMANSFHEVGYQIRYVIRALQMLFKGEVSVGDLSGPVGIVDMVTEVVEESTSDEATWQTNTMNIFLNLMQFAIMISANLGVMNLLPIPGLDGGRLLFLIIEAVRRKPVDRAKEGMVHFVGLMLLMVLMVFVMYQDIRRLF